MIADSIPLILMIEANVDDIRAVQCWLRHSHRKYELSVVRCVEDAYRVIADRRPDLILLDLTLYESDGLTTLDRVRHHAGEIPIVVFTSYADHGMAIRAVRSGAEDYILKNEVTSPEHLTRPIDLAIERHCRKSLEHSLVAYEHQLDLAHRMQQMALPNPNHRFANVQWGGRCEPADQAGGDFYDLMDLPCGGLAFVIADVSGHGLDPAMLMMETRAIVRAMSIVCDDPGVILTHANQLLCRDIQMRYFVTLYLGILSSDRRTLRYASAGHPGYLLRGPNPPLPLTSTDPPLGIQFDKVFSTASTVTISRSQTLLLFTDGILNSILDDVVPETFESTVERANGVADEPIGFILDRLFANVDRHSPRRDDCTALLIRTN
ncbi:PP2C family protein-serine/threonine phosphatase [Novipirellula artificiosorum]|uniref:Phosphoserine phosphatase RsbP n=1 Tax=Novipirellula artificiosorum TaxID=2528016 RepID=A0A5C6D837_9BACT|nr:fused response regulator/phosphatase [Novipirellula artificiosorum]TWU33000.1 Phosphoserine phosphatase RsbP [Novipirellula artificiosorum]